MTTLLVGEELRSDAEGMDLKSIFRVSGRIDSVNHAASNFQHETIVDDVFEVIIEGRGRLHHFDLK
jgi:hypothetical protein